METIKTQDKIKKNKEFKKLGFTYLETAEIVVHLNTLLANYQVHYNKLRNFHWNVEGPEFFELHEEFENEYNTVKENIDIVAERIRVFGIKPNFTLKKTLELSEIKETERNVSAIEMVREILKDFEILHENMMSALGASLDIGDIATEQILTDFLRALEKRNWMFTSYLK
ncbi:DNA starvation/stationary phase protection protein [Flagellimonas hymeniacidonis]|uniref:DNA starvation/stationary phase protection protein n=1 Tax=Flagellimonas hymeniacidonis TaxID=2603628 RepID=A0A5C8V1H8_9FLAO|nr:DNA starvation/stationary phase protection protein [Flagellimonas hymeniacidonis]TXN35216.1 DNA starvation/stationary phase protection protein [Flagellimonas hymeniacidonis]